MSVQQVCGWAAGGRHTSGRDTNSTLSRSAVGLQTSGLRFLRPEHALNKRSGQGVRYLRHLAPPCPALPQDTPYPSQVTPQPPRRPNTRRNVYLLCNSRQRDTCSSHEVQRGTEMDYCTSSLPYLTLPPSLPSFLPSSLPLPLTSVRLG